MKDLDLKSSFFSTLAAMEQLLEDKTLQSKEIMEEQDRRSRKVKKEQDKIKKREQRAQARGEQKRKPRLRIINFEEPGLEGSKLIDSLPGTDTAISTFYFEVCFKVLLLRVLLLKVLLLSSRFYF
ncbi:hypothetical protein [Piscirickettsia salmonis]|uniref:hypothetical protein n=1 Tax=Piscirickettsia salmonis TaxID=1238 RepID=UPI00137BB625|nr:hypothetical protein [Piscirickettsia salmonis]QHS25675.1 hypothetical protein GW538_06675 [Piscirickettsia salmonis]